MAHTSHSGVRDPEREEKRENAPDLTGKMPTTRRAHKSVLSALHLNLVLLLATVLIITSWVPCGAEAEVDHDGANDATPNLIFRCAHKNVGRRRRNIHWFTWQDKLYMFKKAQRDDPNNPSRAPLTEREASRNIPLIGAVQARPRFDEYPASKFDTDKDVTVLMLSI